MAAILPCFVVYLEVAKALQLRGECWYELAVEPPPRRCSCSVSVREPARHRATAVWVLGLPGKAGPVMGAASQLAHAAPCPASRAGSPHPLYQKFIDRFGGAEYEALALEVRCCESEQLAWRHAICSSVCGGMQAAHS